MKVAQDSFWMRGQSPQSKPNSHDRSRVLISSPDRGQWERRALPSHVDLRTARSVWFWFFIDWFSTAERGAVAISPEKTLIREEVRKKPTRALRKMRHHLNQFNRNVNAQLKWSSIQKLALECSISANSCWFAPVQTPSRVQTGVRNKPTLSSSHESKRNPVYVGGKLSYEGISFGHQHDISQDGTCFPKSVKIILPKQIIPHHTLLLFTTIMIGDEEPLKLRPSWSVSNHFIIVRGKKNCLDPVPVALNPEILNPVFSKK